MTETQAQTRFVLQARLREGNHGAGPDEPWYDMDGFSYGTLEELRDCYDKHFKRIEGMGCDYRFKREHMVLTTEIIEAKETAS